jgi:phytanoyl-CoA hydroxylase
MPAETIRTHPRNTAFQWAPTRGPLRLISEEQARLYDEQGGFLLKGAFTLAEMDQVAAAIDPFEQQAEAHLRTLPGGRLRIARADAITFTVHLVARSAELNAFSRHPVFRDLCHDLIGPQVRLYWDQAVFKKPGNPEDFPWHQDNGYTYTKPQQYLTCWVALNDATVDNGCPWIAPGLHRLGTVVHEATELGWKCLDDPDGAIAIPARKGDVVVFSSLTPHRTGPNLTAGVRKSYILQYAPEGAVAWPAGAAKAVPQNDPVRQYRIDV